MAKKDKTKDELPKAKFTKENFKKSLRLFKYLEKSKWMFACGMFFLAGTAGIGLYFPVVAGKLFGYFGADANSFDTIKPEVVETGLTLLVLLLVQGVFSFGRVYTFSLVTENILKGLRTETFD